MRIRRTLTTSGAVALALATASVLSMSPAHADGPTHSVETLDFSLAEHGPTSEACGFPVAIHIWGSWNVVALTDDGNLTKEIRNFRFQGELSANGVTVRGISRGPEVYRYDADGSFTMAVHGIVNRRIPGAGTVTLASGLQVIFVDGEAETVLFQSGPDDEDVAAICAAFTE